MRLVLTLVAGGLDALQDALPAAMDAVAGAGAPVSDTALLGDGAMDIFTQGEGPGALRRHAAPRSKRAFRPCALRFAAYPARTHAITAVAGLTCPNPASPGQATSPSPKPLPPSLVIKAVVRCETVQRSYPVGSWSVQLAEVADSGLGPFLADLQAPSDPRPSGIMCPDFRILVPWFELVDSAGTAMNVAIPTDQCGAPKTAAITALQALPFRVTDAVRISAVH